MVDALYSQGALNQGQSNSLLSKLENAQRAIDKGKPKEAYNVVGAFKNEVQALIASGRLAPAQGNALLTATDLLLQSLLIGGGI